MKGESKVKIHALLIQGGSVFIAEVSFIPAWESKVQMFKGFQMFKF